MLRISLLIWFWCALAAATQAQVTPVEPLVNREQVVAPSGKLKRHFLLAASPGASYALYFQVPAAKGPLTLTGIWLHLQTFGRDTARGSVRVRVASVTATGAPAEDDLLPTSIVLTTSVLQVLDKPVLLNWPTKRVSLPAAGFFIVVEGLGNTPDEYTTNSPATAKSICSDCYTIGRRNEPNAPLRLLAARSVPKLLVAKPAISPFNYWIRGGHLPIWQAFASSKEVPLLEAVFE